MKNFSLYSSVLLAGLITQACLFSDEAESGDNNVTQITGSEDSVTISSSSDVGTYRLVDDKLVLSNVDKTCDLGVLLEETEQDVLEYIIKNNKLKIKNNGECEVYTGSGTNVEGVEWSYLGYQYLSDGECSGDIETSSGYERILVFQDGKVISKYEIEDFCESASVLENVSVADSSEYQYMVSYYESQIADNQETIDFYEAELQDYPEDSVYYSSKIAQYEAENDTLGMGLDSVNLLLANIPNYEEVSCKEIEITQNSKTYSRIYNSSTTDGAMSYTFKFEEGDCQLDIPAYAELNQENCSNAYSNYESQLDSLRQEIEEDDFYGSSYEPYFSFFTFANDARKEALDLFETCVEDLGYDADVVVTFVEL